MRSAEKLREQLEGLPTTLHTLEPTTDERGSQRLWKEAALITVTAPTELKLRAETDRFLKFISHRSACHLQCLAYGVERRQFNPHVHIITSIPQAEHERWRRRMINFQVSKASSLYCEVADWRSDKPAQLAYDYVLNKHEPDQFFTELFKEPLCPRPNCCRRRGQCIHKLSD